MSISVQEYQAFTPTTAKYRRDDLLFALSYLTNGLASEAGEVCGKFKKLIRDTDAEVTGEFVEAFASEIGDVLWYCSQLCNELDLDLSLVMANNQDKLSGRQARGTLGGSGDNR